MLRGRGEGRARTGPAHMGGASRGPPDRGVGLWAQARVGSGRGVLAVSVLSPCCRALRSAAWNAFPGLDSLPRTTENEQMPEVCWPRTHVIQGHDCGLHPG